MSDGTGSWDWDKRDWDRQDERDRVGRNRKVGAVRALS